MLVSFKFNDIPYKIEKNDCLDFINFIYVFAQI